MVIPIIREKYQDVYTHSYKQQIASISNPIPPHRAYLSKVSDGVKDVDGDEDPTDLFGCQLPEHNEYTLDHRYSEHNEYTLDHRVNTMSIPWITDSAHNEYTLGHRQ